ncbi:fatty acid desaturase [Adhaeribacter sp. BT258]|uniref:Fatty acid desaturase n=1 Tax=Adhaeribacter terrigena TaxID=2793070 RepID=A0ABS1C1J3_9BACT|nr:fatty acid desaturase [Adhaeribacter terrigena]MBK0403247.1 fatty acid desaturase [Adhaeribacter terrigena]
MKAKSTRPGNFTLTKAQQMVEITRPWVLLAFYIAFAFYGLWWLAIAAAFATCLAAFVQLHDSIHNSLGLSKKGHDRLLSLSALLLLKSGHALKVTHLRHHGQCLSDDDPEGEPAKWTLKQVFLNGPYHIFTLRFASLRIAPNTRNMQLAETAATALLLVIFIAFYFVWGSVIGLVYWAVAFVLSALMPLWASYIPHKMASRNPTRMLGVKSARFWTPILSSFAFHHLHHTYPKVPTALLPKAAQELPEPEDHDHFH